MLKSTTYFRDDIVYDVSKVICALESAYVPLGLVRQNCPTALSGSSSVQMATMAEAAVEPSWHVNVRESEEG